MLVWGLTLAAMVLAVTAIQVAAYYYLIRDDSPTAAVEPDPDTAALGDSEADWGDRSRANGDGGGDGERRRCPDCGAPNGGEGIYTFCANCGAKL